MVMVKLIAAIFLFAAAFALVWGGCWAITWVITKVTPAPRQRARP